MGCTICFFPVPCSLLERSLGTRLVSVTSFSGLIWERGQVNHVRWSDHVFWWSDIWQLIWSMSLGILAALTRRSPPALGRQSLFLCRAMATEIQKIQGESPNSKWCPRLGLYEPCRRSAVLYCGMWGSYRPIIIRCWLLVQEVVTTINVF